MSVFNNGDYWIGARGGWKRLFFRWLGIEGLAFFCPPTKDLYPLMHTQYTFEIIIKSNQLNQSNGFLLQLMKPELQKSATHTHGRVSVYYYSWLHIELSIDTPRDIYTQPLAKQSKAT